MATFQVSITESDFVQASRLQFEPSKSSIFNAKSVAFLIVVAATLGPIAFLIHGSMSLLPFLPMGLFAGILIYLAVLLPSRLRTLYSQQPELQQPMSISFNSETIQGSNSLGSFSRNWESLAKWMENSSYLVLFLNDLQTLVIPKAQIDDQAILDELRMHLKNAEIPFSQGNNVYAVLALFLILWLGFLLSIAVGFVGL